MYVSLQRLPLQLIPDSQIRRCFHLAHIAMASPAPKALLFDVFGTCVDWRTTVTYALYNQCHASLNSATASLATSVRMTASDMSLEDWGRFAQQWRNSYKDFVRSLAADPSLPWKTVDEHHLSALQRLLSEWKLDGLWTEEEISDINLIWHRLEPWPDSSRGINLLNKNFDTVTLSNGNMELLNDLKDHGSMGFTHIFSADMFKSYKPSPKVYLGAVERLGLEPQQCAMVAAHLGDLKAAKSNGLRAIYVERPLEEDWDPKEVEEARKEGWVDVWVPQDQEGFVTLAKELGVGVDNER